MVILSILVVLLAGVVMALAYGRLGDGISVSMSPAVHTTGHDLAGEVLDGGLDSAPAVTAVRFDRALRGYRMDQVDAVLDRLGVLLEERDERIARLEAATREPAPEWGDEAVPPAGAVDEPSEIGPAEDAEAHPRADDDDPTGGSESAPTPAPPQEPDSAPNPPGGPGER